MLGEEWALVKQNKYINRNVSNQKTKPRKHRPPFSLHGGRLTPGGIMSVLTRGHFKQKHIQEKGAEVRTKYRLEIRRSHQCLAIP